MPRLLALLLALASPASGAASDGPDHVRLQLKWFHQFQFAGYYAAQEKGYYREAGLEVELVEGSHGRPPAAEVLAGRAQFGVLDGADALTQRLRGSPLVAVAVVFQHSPAVVVARRWDGIRVPHDLAGRTLMMTGGQGEAAVRAMLRREGLEVDGPDPARSVRTVPHSWNAGDLVTGKVDALSAYLTAEPVALRRIGVDVALLRPIDYGIDFYGDTLFTSEAFLAGHPDLVQRFVRASMEGWAYAMAHPAELAELIAARGTRRAPPPSREDLLAEAAAMRDLVLPDLVELGHMNLGRWERMGEELRLIGAVPDTRRLDGFVPEPRGGRTLEVVAGVAGAVLLLAAVALLWVWQLRRTVRERTADLRREVALREEKSLALEESLRTNRAILSTIPDLLFVNRRDGTFVEHHARSAEDLVVPPSAFLGKTPRDVLPPELAERFLAAIPRAIDEDALQVIEYPLDVGGRRKVYEARLVRQGPETALTIIRDVTEAHEARARLALLGAAIEQAAEDVLITDAAGIVRYVNPAFERTTGYAAAEVLGRTPALLRSGRHDAAFYRALWETLGAGQVWQGRFTNRTKHGALILQDASIVAIRDGAGAVTGYVSTRADVTQRVELEAQLAHSQRMEAIGTLAGGIAHDFNNILGAIVANAELALDSAGAVPAAVEELQAVLDASTRGAELVRQILAFSRRTAHEARPVDVAAMVEESARLLRATLPATVQLVTRLAARGRVMGDASELQRVLVNLCANGAHALRDGGGRLEVGLEEVALEEGARARQLGVAPGRYLKLTVADTGCGMTPEVRARIFEPFFTTRPVGEGTGMGLAIVHGVVRRLGGAVEVESAPGQGTTFDVLLPLLDAAEAPARPAPAGPRGGAGRILVVDDEPMLVRALERMLGRLGFTVRGFVHPRDALRALEEDPQAFDAVVTDLAMPQLAGDELARRIRAVRADLPVILCTGNRRDLSDEVAAALGVAEVLEKPLRGGELAEALRRQTSAPRRDGA